MADTFSLAVRAFLSSAQLGGIAFNPPQITGTPDYSALSYILASGDNTIPVPSLATVAVVIFDLTSTTVKKLKGAAGDTGITLHSTLLVLPISGSSFIINSNLLDTGKITEIVFF